MQFINFEKQYRRLQPGVNQAIERVLESNCYIMGPEVVALEERLATFAGVKHCIGVSNGSDALLIAMLVLGVGPGDEVITPAFSFIAVAEMAVLIGAKPVFIDVDPRTYHLDVRLLEGLITEKTKAIVPVSLYGQCADYDAINAIAARHQIPVIDDAAQSFGATYKGRSAGGLSTITCTSFYPTKPLGCYGDGGACFTDDDVLAEAMRQCRHHGQSAGYQHDRLGMTGRLDAMQAVILFEKMKIFEDEIKRRQAAAAQYDTLLADVATVPYIEPHNTSAYAQYTIQIDDRDACRARLQEAGIPTAIHYPKPIYQQAAYRHLVPAGFSLPVTELLCERVLSLPMHPYLEQAEIEQVAKMIQSDLQGQSG